MDKLDLSREDFEGIDANNMSPFEKLLTVAAVAQWKISKIEKGTMKMEEDEDDEDARLKLLRKQKGKMKMEEEDDDDDEEAVRSVSTKQEGRVVENTHKKKGMVDSKRKGKEPMVMMEKEPDDYETLLDWNNNNRRGALSCKKESNHHEDVEPSDYMEERTRSGWQRRFADNLVDQEINMSTEKRGHKKRNVDDLCMEKKKSNPSNALVIYDANDQDPDYDDQSKQEKKQKGVKQRKPRPVRHNNNNNEAPMTIIPDMPQRFKDKIASMGGRDVKLVIQKVLYMSDLIVSQNRCSMPFKQLRSRFLEDDEMALLANKATLTIPLIDTRLRLREIALVQWTLHTSSWYVLKTQWHTVTQDNEFVERDVIQIWSFRDQGNNLHFAMVLLDRDNGQAGNAPQQLPQELNAVLPGIVINENNGESSGANGGDESSGANGGDESSNANGGDESSGANGGESSNANGGESSNGNAGGRSV